MRRRKHILPEAFCSNLFIEAEKRENETRLFVSEEETSEDYYHVGDTVSYMNSIYEISSIDYEKKEVVVRDPDFPISQKRLDFEELFLLDTNNKKFINKSTNYPSETPKEDFDFSKFIGSEFLFCKKPYRLLSEQDNDVVVEDMELSNSKLTLLTPKQILKKSEIINILKQLRITEFTEDKSKTGEKPVETTDSTDSPIVLNNTTSFVLPDTEEYRTIGERIVDNLNAIKILKEIEKDNEGRVEKVPATQEQREILAKYSGWGGLTEIFDPKKNNSHRNELLSLLTEEEYQSASTSMLDAYFTPYFVIKSIYNMLVKNGFTQGNIIEPSCGSGRFFGLMPKEIRKKSALIGVELDTITARIASYLYPEATIRNSGYEKVFLGRNCFDLAITNVPFGDITVNDAAYNKYKWSIHDYFISRMIDQVKPGGIVVALTSSYSLDKQNKSAREYWAHRAELISAIRLPNSLFKNSHTEVVTDVLVFKKREQYLETTENCEEWLDTDIIEVDGVEQRLNLYYINHKDNICGELIKVSGQHGERLTVEGEIETVSELIENISFDYTYSADKIIEQDSIDVPKELIDTEDYSFCMYNEKLYFKEEGRLKLVVPKNNKQIERILGLIRVRDIYNQLVNAMETTQNKAQIYALQQDLSAEYDCFVKRLGRICSVANSRAFSDDLKYANLCSLEIYDDEGNFKRKADIFTEITINKGKEYVAESEVDALQISIAEKGKIDFEFMSLLSSMSKSELIEKLTAERELFKIPFSKDCYEIAETYLSGYVKKKLKVAMAAAETDDSYKINVEALEAVQPKDIQANDIYAPLGATWIPAKYYEKFIEHLFKVPHPEVALVNEKYHITPKEYGNIPSQSTYGTYYCSGLRLFEDALNLKSTKIYEDVQGMNGKIKRVVDKERTQVVQAKQEQIKLAWLNWVWNDYNRRTELVRIYNDTMNDLVPTKYDGSKMIFKGMASNIELMPHQKNAVARIVRKGNTLLSHKVGFGKTFTMIAAAMERKRLGLSNKPLFVVPNHLVAQWAGEITRLYPFANVLITRQNDFEPKNRKKFSAKISSGNWDMVVMSHSQFGFVPLSKEHQLQVLENEKKEIEATLNEVRESNSSYTFKSYSIKDLNKRKKALVAEIEKLNERKVDNNVTFEQLGVDMLFVDEAHLFKNLKVITKLHNVAGLTNAASRKASNLKMKVDYLNEITNYQGVVFATGTPITNAVCELYVMQRYLQNEDLQLHGIYSFDSWITRFSETENKIEVKPEGTGYRSVTRVCKYHNLPELMNIYTLVADIQNSNDVKLDVPERRNHNIAVNPSKIQQEIVKSFAERAEKIRGGSVDSSKDNMLCVTNDGRKVAIDQRLYDISLPDDKHSKLNRCTRTVYRIWKWTRRVRAAQVIFCDLGTPKSKNDSKKATFDVYNEIKTKLISFGVPEEEIAFIHDANTDTKRITLFDKVNKGIVRVLLGSTEKLGAGSNIQKRLLAIHNVDCPWRPSDLEQRAGRIIRQLNMFSRAHIYSYVTKNTFDTYLYQTVLSKAEFIAQINNSNLNIRDMEDVDTTCLNYAEIKSLSTGNPFIKEKMELEQKVAKLKIVRSNFLSQKYELERCINSAFPLEIQKTQNVINAIKADIEIATSNPIDSETKFAPMTIMGVEYSAEQRKDAAQHFQSLVETEKSITETKLIGSFRGFEIGLNYNIRASVQMCRIFTKTSNYTYVFDLSDSALGNIQRLINAINSLPAQLDNKLLHLKEVEENLASAKKQIDSPFEQEEEYLDACNRLAELNKKLAVEGENGLENILSDDVA